MKLGVFAVLFGDLSFAEMLDKVAASGLEAVEIGCGGHPGKAHCNPAELLGDKTALRKFKEAVTSRGLEISALSVHGNPLHPNREMAVRDHADFVDAVHLAEELGVSTVNTFAGCPGESDQSLNPSWVTCPWPNEYAEVLRWQWDEKVLPYWSKQNEFVKAHGVRVAIEPHPGFVVYNTETCLHIHEGCGEQIGINFDPSHLFWQHMDPVSGIKALAKAGALFHVHAKDTGFDAANMAATVKGKDVVSKVRVAVIGCGSIAKHRHIPEYASNPRVELIAFCDIVRERAECYAERYNAVVYTDYEELLEKESIDAISVCLPNYLHAPVSIAAAKSGAHVLCEKPMATSREDAEDMIQAAKDNKVFLMIGHNQRLMRPHVKAKELLERGYLGKVISFRTAFGHPGQKFGALMVKIAGFLINGRYL